MRLERSAPKLKFIDNRLTGRYYLPDPGRSDQEDEKEDMEPIRILQGEMLAFFWLLTATLGYRMLTREINLSGLLTDGVDRRQVSPERVQLLVSTLAVSVKYIGDVLHSQGGAMPNVSTPSLVVFGASGGIYGAVKAFKVLRLPKRLFPGEAK